MSQLRVGPSLALQWLRLVVITTYGSRTVQRKFLARNNAGSLDPKCSSFKIIDVGGVEVYQKDDIEGPKLREWWRA